MSGDNRNPWDRSVKPEFNRAADKPERGQESRSSEGKESREARRPDTSRHAPTPGMKLEPKGPVRTAAARETFQAKQAKEAEWAKGLQKALDERSPDRSQTREKSRDERER